MGEWVITRLGCVLREAREDAGYNQRALSRAVSFSGPMISLVESGRRTPSLKYLAEVASVLGVPVWELIQRAEGRD